MNLELMAMRWLWLEKDCHYILEQRSPRLFCGVPDVIGITKSRYLIEIEIKRSVADFRNDFKKPQIVRRNTGTDTVWGEMQLKHYPKYFYYLMPRKIYEKVINEIPAWAGVLCESENQVTAMVLKKSPSNSEPNRLSTEECVRAVRLMVNHMMTGKLDEETHHARFRDKDTMLHVHWVNHEKGTYEI